MLRLTAIFLMLALITACTNTTVEKETYGDGKLKTEKVYEGKGENKTLVKEVHYYNNGKKYIEGNYSNNKRDGYWASWYENGQLWSEGNFIDGLSEGKRTVYHQNGKLYYEGSFVKGERTGIWRFFDEEGKLVNEIDYSKVPEKVKE